MGNPQLRLPAFIIALCLMPVYGYTDEVSEQTPFVTGATAFSAQNNTQDMCLGVRIGLNSSNVGTGAGNDLFVLGFDPGNLDDAKSRYSFTVGIFAEKQITHLISLQLGLSYVQKGYRLEFDELNMLGDPIASCLNRCNFSYLEIPVAAKVRIPKSYGLYALLGAYMSVWLSGTVDIESDDIDVDAFYSSTSVEPHSDFKDYYDMSAFDFGAILGIGFDVSLKRYVLNIELKYSVGISYLAPNNDKPVPSTMPDDLYLRNRSFSLTTGIGMRL